MNDKFHGPAKGIRRGSVDGREIIDAMAGRASVFGFGFEPIVDAIRSASDAYLGDAGAWTEIHARDDRRSSPLAGVLREMLTPEDGIRADKITLVASPDLAIEHVVAIARSRSEGRRFRTIGIVGSDHGRTGLCRTASGRPELHEGFGPMMAGFAHAPPEDLNAIASMIDDQTGCILLSPIDFAQGGVAVAPEYLEGLRRLCDEHDLLLALDETQLVLGASGTAFTFVSIARIEADIVAASSGWFGGMSGGVVIANERSLGEPSVDFDCHPLLSTVAAQTLRSMIDADLPSGVSETARDFAIALAESVSAYDFVRDVHATGMTISIELDIESAVLVQSAASCGLRIETAGDLAIRLQLPLRITDDDRHVILSRLGDALDATQRATTELSV